MIFIESNWLMLFLIIFYLALGIGIGFIGKNREIGFLAALIISILLTPFVGLIVCFVSPSITLAKDKYRLRPQKQFELAKRYEAIGELQEALSLYKNLILKDYKSPFVHMKIARIYSIMNQPEMSYKHFKYAKDVGEQMKVYIDEQEEFKALKNYSRYQQKNIT